MNRTASLVESVIAHCRGTANANVLVFCINKDNAADIVERLKQRSFEFTDCDGDKVGTTDNLFGGKSKATVRFAR